MTLTQINKAGLDEIALDHVFTIGASGSSAYTFQGEGLNGTVNNPTLYLTRGNTYRFENGSGGHPIRIQSTSGASGTAYNTGVTNHAGSGTVIVEVHHDAPDVLYYQCTSHAAMNGILYITGALADGGVTTAKLADDAVTYAKIQNVAQDRILGRQSSGSGDVQELNATNVRLMLNVENGATADQTKSDIDALNVKAGTIDIQSTSSSFNYDVLFANGSGDKQVAIDGSQHIKYNPSSNTLTTGVFEGSGASLTNLPAANLTGTLPAIDGSNLTGITSTTINNNADNKIITGSGTANTLEAESTLLYSNPNLEINTDTSPYGSLILNGNTGGLIQFEDNEVAKWSIFGDSALNLYDNTNSASRLYIAPGGNVGIGVSNPNAYDSYANQLVVYGAGHAGMTIRGNYANTGNIYFADGTSGGEKYDGYISYSYPTQRLSFGAGGNTIAKVTTDGVCFGSDTSAANALDDYEEGSWTPTMSNTGSLSNGVAAGRYTKIGRMVHFVAKLQWSNRSTNGGYNITFGSLPFTAASYFQFPIYVGGNEGFADNYSDRHHIGGSVQAGTTYGQFRISSSDGQSEISFHGGHGATNAGYIYWGGTYYNN